MEWFNVDDAPATSNRYLVYSRSYGYSYFADYSSLKKKWTTGERLDKEECHIDFWAFEPLPEGE